jgi:hypothetical protein
LHNLLNVLGHLKLLLIGINPHNSVWIFLCQFHKPLSDGLMKGEPCRLHPIERLLSGLSPLESHFWIHIEPEG